ncbi:uncharacterized protein F5891DRAFT_1127984 [Suillus fuscotomentosus]|uniref:Uncharacterized protein n=1 Tax=Suillus fuscotomentosus TaxID=1912939 RepID=A0AAD4E8M4_9AGAM|nr:uncharacterized protein F5891DRAFT_1127984 [Suillus fuscotomentosus]KAG1901750.1 hypothetical protein F5891DRAFT_1127984 [Suillus fuscotomentosus]
MIAKIAMLLVYLKSQSPTYVPVKPSDKSRRFLFDDLPVKQAFYYLEPTMRVARHFIECCPGNVTVDTLGLSLANVSTIVFVIHIRGLYQHPISKLVEFSRCVPNQPNINFKIFGNESPEFEQFPLTSIYDHSVREVFSCVLYKLIDPLPYLLNIFCSVFATDACRLSPMLAPTPPPIATTSTPTSGTTPSGTSPLTSSTSPVPGTTLTYHLVMPHLALLALLPTTVYDMRRGLGGVREIWESRLHGVGVG